MYIVSWRMASYLPEDELYDSISSVPSKDHSIALT
jgi:hypothetical protein